MSQSTATNTTTKALVKGEDRARKEKLITYLDSRQTLTEDAKKWLRKKTW